MAYRRGPLLYQDWNHLLFLHWKTDPAELTGQLPPGVILDLFGGNAYVGLIPFTVTNSRPFFSPPIPLMSNFHEVNVRTYVRYGDDPGVLFFSLDAASRANTVGARTTYRLPYHFARMRMAVSGEPAVVEYESERQWPPPVPATCSLRYRVGAGPSRRAEPGTLDHFLIERYTLYTSSDGRLYRATVQHQPYSIQSAEVKKLEETLVAAAGVRKIGESPIVHYARGIHVGINGLERV